MKDYFKPSVIRLGIVLSPTFVAGKTRSSQKQKFSSHGQQCFSLGSLCFLILFVQLATFSFSGKLPFNMPYHKLGTRCLFNNGICNGIKITGKSQTRVAVIVGADLFYYVRPAIEFGMYRLFRNNAGLLTEPSLFCNTPSVILHRCVAFPCLSFRFVFTIFAMVQNVRLNFVPFYSICLYP